MGHDNTKATGKSIPYTADPHAKNENKPALGVLKSTPAKETWKPNAGGRK